MEMTTQSLESQGLTTRKLQSLNDQKLFFELLNQAFPVPKGKNFTDDFPIWNPKFYPASQIAGVFSGDRLVAAAGARLGWLKNGSRKIPIGLIGAVATAPAWRGKGIASEMVLDLERELVSRGAYAVMLWGAEHALYQRMGYDLCGVQKRIPLSSLSVLDANVDRSQNAQVHTGWNEALLPLLCKKPSGLVIEGFDVAWIREHKNVQWVWTGSPDNPRAFVAYNRGIDLQGIIHEWGGAQDGLFLILSELKKQNPALELLGQPALFDFFQIPHAGIPVEYLCMSKIFEPHKLINHYHPTFPGKIAKEPSGLWKATLGTESVELNDNSVSVLLFGPEKFEGEWEKYFPLPLWMWGLDAV